MDDFDIKILRALQEDGRLTNNDLAEEVGLSPSQCSRRRAALEEEGVIASYHAVLSSEVVGLDVLVFVHVTLATHSPDNAQRFAALVESLDEVQEAYSLTGEFRLSGKALGADTEGPVTAPCRCLPTASFSRSCALLDCS